MSRQIFISNKSMEDAGWMKEVHYTPSFTCDECYHTGTSDRCGWCGGQGNRPPIVDVTWIKDSNRIKSYPNEKGLYADCKISGRNEQRFMELGLFSLPHKFS